MNILRKISKKFKIRLSPFLVSLLMLGIIGGIIGAIVYAEWYPNRPAYDYNKPCDPTDSDPYDRCGSLTGPVFNSFINTPSYGDERAFVDARRSDQTAAGSYKNVLPDVTQGSKEIVVRMYVHNNANQSTNCDPSNRDANGNCTQIDPGSPGIATNTKVRFFIPTATDSSLRARGYISADNSTPKVVEDTVDFTSGEKFKVEYIPGSARLVNNFGFKNGVALPDSIVTTGTQIGNNALDGNVPGCFEYEAIVHIRLRVIPVETSTEVEFNKEVGVAGQDGWGEQVTVKPGEKIKWLVFFKNKGTSDLTNVTINDQLPPHVELVPGTVRYIDANQDVVQKDTPLFTDGGINFFTWKPGGGFYIRFETTAKDNFEGCEITLRNVAFFDTDQTDKGQDHADVKIVRENCVVSTPPTQLPVTGPGEIVGAFMAVSAASTVAHRIFFGRRFIG